MLAMASKKIVTNVTDEDSLKKGSWNGYKNKESLQIITRRTNDSVSSVLPCEVIYTHVRAHTKTLIRFEM
jgi:hypothetical protein